MEVATFGAGCFWSVEETFRNISGVTETSVGFMGGGTENPTYDQVCAGDTGHAEVVHISYDSKKIPYKDLLKVFWECHDPTQLNRQGFDAGFQYRSVIFYHTPEQEKLATKTKEKLQKSITFSRIIVTAIEPAGKFYKADEYHQKYICKKM